MIENVEIVEAGDGDILRQAEVPALAFQRRADRQHVAGTEHGVRPLLQVEQPDQRVPPAGQSLRRFQDQLPVRFEVQFLQRGQVAAAALAHAVIGFRGQRHEGDAAVTPAVQMVGHRLRRLEVRIADHDVDRIPGQVAGFDDRNVGLRQDGANPRRMGRVVQDDAAHLLAEKGQHQLFLHFQRMTALGDQHMEAGLAEIVGNRLNGLGKQRVAQARDDQPDDIGMPGGQVTGQPVGDIAGLLDGVADALAGLLRHGIRRPQRARHGHRRHTGEARDVAHAHGFRLTCRMGARKNCARRDFLGHGPCFTALPSDSATLPFPAGSSNGNVPL